MNKMTQTDSNLGINFQDNSKLGVLKMLAHALKVKMASLGVGVQSTTTEKEFTQLITLNTTMIGNRTEQIKIKTLDS